MMKKKKTLTLLGSLVLGASVVSTASTASSVTLESQGWWNADGIQVPNATGSHLHVKATVPDPWTPVDRKIDIPVVVGLHNQVGSTSWFRITTQNRELYRRELKLGPCADCSTSFTATIDVSRLSTGRHELRLTVNNPDEDPTRTGAQRMFQSTGWQVCVRACSPSYRAGDFIEARGWYDARPSPGVAHGYANARLKSNLSTLLSRGTIKVSLKRGSGGKPTTFAGVYIDPDFHHGSSGIVVREWNGSYTGSVVLPFLPSGPHRLVLISSDGKNAGVQVVPFVVP